MEFISEIKAQIKELDFGPRALRHFGVLFWVVFWIVAGIIVYKHGLRAVYGHPWAVGFEIAGGLFLLAGYAFPAVLKTPYRLWMGLAVVMGIVMSSLILTLVYYLMMTPIGLVMRLFGKDPMNRKIDREAETYWRPRAPETNDPARVEKMF